jgi:hypothetical protein
MQAKVISEWDLKANIWAQVYQFLPILTGKPAGKRSLGRPRRR